jgi:hypothetical protein
MRKSRERRPGEGGGHPPYRAQLSQTQNRLASPAGGRRLVPKRGALTRTLATAPGDLWEHEQPLGRFPNQIGNQKLRSPASGLVL